MSERRVSEVRDREYGVDWELLVDTERYNTLGSESDLRVASGRDVGKL